MVKSKKNRCKTKKCVKTRIKTRKYKRQRGGQTKKSKTKSFKKLNCNPTTKFRKTADQTCYDDSQLKYIRSLWNVKHPDDKIDASASSASIWALLKKKYQAKCNDEKCWIDELKKGDSGKNSKINVKSLENSFAPDAPEEWKKNPNAWLSDKDINDVMKQYEQAYKCFEFIGPSPIDFDTRVKDPLAKQLADDDCVWEELCKFSVKKYLKKGKTKIGVIFNTDPHDKSGEHWISLFINLKKGKIFFFDSVGSKAPKEIMVLVDRIIKQGLKQSPPIHFEFDQNYPVEHQYSSTECGVYSNYFIIHMLEDKLTAKYLKTHILTDNYISKFRKKYYN